MHPYKITMVNEKERWIFISGGEWDKEVPDAFVALMKKIQSRVGGSIVEFGSGYGIPEDGLGLCYQWDTLFGISVVYPETAQLAQVTAFLEAAFQ